MMSHLFDYEALVEGEDFAVKRYKDSLYKGTMIEKDRQGVGVLIYGTGRVYEG